METDELEEFIQKAPREPGVYLFREGESERDRVLYVGKAVDVRERLRSYRDPRSPRIRKMVEGAEYVETRQTQDERKALLLEANLIKRHQPKYNTRLKDGKTYPVIELTEHEFPQIRMSRDPEADSMVFGPFTSVRDIETGIKAFRDLYGLRACSDHTVQNRDRPCVPYQMGLCSAPCAGLITESEYAERVQTVRSFFREDPEPVFEELTELMEEAAEDRRYERAGTLKGYREALGALSEGRQSREGETHAIAVGPEGGIGRVILEKDSITEKKRHRLVGEPGSDREAVSTFIQQFYSRTELPERILTEKVPEDGMTLRWLGSESTEIEEPEDGRDRVLIDSARSAATTGGVGSGIEELEETLNRDISRIEGFDISHTGGKDTVGSNVVFEAGTPEKSGYRRTNLEGNDDYRNMKELLRWRGERACSGRDERPDPDVVLIDGGEKQLEAALSGMDSAGWEPSAAVLGMVKPEDEVVGPSVRDPDVSKVGQKLLASVRDEAHRFAKSSHKKRRDTVGSVLEEITGVGPKLSSRILSEFSIEGLKDKDAGDLQQIEGIGPSTAQRITDEVGE
jgi:excinuclease ABC subunit C